MSRRATHLLHPENSLEHQRRTVKNIREEQSRNIREEQSRTSEDSQEHQRRTVKNIKSITVRTSKLSPVMKVGNKNLYTNKELKTKNKIKKK